MCHTKDQECNEDLDDLVYLCQELHEGDLPTKISSSTKISKLLLDATSSNSEVKAEND